MAKEDGLYESVEKVREEVSKVVVGLESLKELILVAILSGGHILIEGPAGTAKTTIARMFARALGGEFKRIQFTPDMLPSDVTGFYLHTLDGSAKFVPGAIFANVVLADELNRTTPRTQSALLEAMQEEQVTVEGEAHVLPQPFMVIATQLKYGAEGTYPLTEVQVDRFMLRAESSYPSYEVEKQILERVDFLEHPDVRRVIDLGVVFQLRQAVGGVFVSGEIEDYIITLISEIRQEEDFLGGVGPRASMSLYRGVRALAFLDHRDFVIPDDVKKLALPVLWHRIQIRPEAEMDGTTPQDVIERVMERVAVPK